MPSLEMISNTPYLIANLLHYGNESLNNTTIGRSTVLIITFISTLLLSFSAFADEKTQEIIAYTAEALEFADVEIDEAYLDSLTEFSIHINPEDYVLYLLEQGGENFVVQCHYHSAGGTHCSETHTNIETSEHGFSELFSVNASEVSAFFSDLKIDVSTVDSNLLPWVVGALVSYYFAKKGLNYWLHKAFFLRNVHSHDHSHFFIEVGDPLNQRIEEEREQVSLPLERLQDIGDYASKLEGTEENLKKMLNDKLLAMAGLIISELKKASHSHSCSGCGHPDHDHEVVPFALSTESSQFTSTQSLLGATAPTSFDTSSLVEQLNLDEAKDTISSGVMMKYARAIAYDLYDEFIKPFKRAVTGTYGMFTDSDKRRQMNSFAQSRYRNFLGEAHVTVATSIAAVMATIKISGETLETMLFGPLHVLCQISDVAAVTTGLTILVSYHCLRQPVRRKDPKLLLNKTFWKVFLSRLKTPFRKDMTEEELEKANDGLEVMISEVNKIKRALSSLIWLLRYDEKITPAEANELSLELGRINKAFENQYFDIQIQGDDLSGEEMLAVLNKLAPVLSSYNSFYLSLFSKTEYTSINSHIFLTCRKLLSTF